MSPLLAPDTPITDAVLAAIAHMPTASLPVLVDPVLQARLDDAQLMRIAVLLAEKSRAEGGCPIGAVIRRDADGVIVGKGHNTLVQEGHPYNHGETSAIRDAGRLDFSQTTIYTSLSPCDVCTALLRMRRFSRVVIGNVRSLDDRGEANIAALRGAQPPIEVKTLEDDRGVALYEQYRQEAPDLDLEDWRGLAAVRGDRSGD